MSDYFAKSVLIQPLHLQHSVDASPVNMFKCTGKKKAAKKPMAEEETSKSVEPEIKKSNTETETHMSTEFDEIFKGFGGKKSGAPKPVARQKQASQIGNAAEPTRGGQKSGSAPRSRGGLHTGNVDRTEPGQKPHKTSITMPDGGAPGKKVKKSLPITPDNQFHLVQYVDNDPAK